MGKIVDKKETKKGENRFLVTEDATFSAMGLDPKAVTQVPEKN